MATRVFELARELGVTSKAVLDKCRAEGLELKNHMAALSAGLEATIREWFSEGESTTAVETAEHIDLDSARKEARRRRRRAAAELAEGATGVDTAVEEAEPAEEEAEAQTAPEEPAIAAEQAAPAEAAPEPAQAAPMAEPEQPAPPAEPAPEAPAEQPRVAAEAPPAEPEQEKKPVRPAGPQLVPRPAQLKGPRVVRVEKPDFVRRPTPSPRTAAAGAGTASTPTRPATPGRRKGIATTTEEEEAAKAKRSPRRRGGGRSADSGEKLREWRDTDLAERSERLAAAGGGLRRHRASVGRKSDGPPGSRAEAKIEVEEPITIKSLSSAMGVKAADIIRRLMNNGILATVNQVIDRQTAESIAVDFEIEIQVKRAKTAEEQLVEQLEHRPKGDLKTRPPVVTFLGHVDHGKTSLLDRIRETAVATGEAGGITQHIGAYRYEKGDARVVFLDTPGHEAFTAMRARGANMTDVVVLVVAADDGVMPQTKEAISHAKAAGVPIIVALNKIDVPNANVQRALGQLAEHDLNPREWGGNTEVIRTSAITGQGIEDLVTTLSLEAELLELKAEEEAPATGYVIEAQMDGGLGVLARLLVRNGTLKVGDVLLAGRAYGRVRQMLDGRGRSIDRAGPSTPVQVAGLDEMPEAGDKFYVSSDLDQARVAAEDRRQRARTQELAAAPKRTLQDLLTRIEAGEANQLALIIKADVQGSIEAIVNSLNKLSTDEVKVNILHSAVGAISAGDVRLAEASSAIIIGFNVVPDATTRSLAESLGIDIRLYRVIYDIIDDIRKALEEGLAPEVRLETLGRAEIRQTYKISRVGTIAGCYVTEGTAQRNAKVRIIRGGVVVEDERSLESLKRFKDDVREVRTGMECGLKVAGYDNIKEGDILEFYHQVEVARKL